jgi:NitT/TauT family transport system permease protein
MGLSRRSGEAWSMVLIVVLTIVAWELACRLFNIRSFILPPPSAIFADLVRAPQYMFVNAVYTLTSTLIGFAIAVVLGVVMAIGIVQSVLLERTLYTWLVILNSVPKVALAPVFVMWLGVGIHPKIAIAVMIAIFSIVIDTVLGLRSIDPDMLNLAKAARASRLQVLLKIQLPNALPSMFAGMKVGIAFALVGAIVGEFVAGEVGLGTVILQAQGSFDTAQAFAAIVLLGLMGTVLFYSVEFVERLVLPWHTSQRAKSGTNVIAHV